MIQTYTTTSAVSIKIDQPTQLMAVFAFVAFLIFAFLTYYFLKDAFKLWWKKRVKKQDVGQIILTPEQRRNRNIKIVVLLLAFVIFLVLLVLVGVNLSRILPVTT